MPEPTGPVSLTSYAFGMNVKQPDRDGADWNDNWPSIDMHRVRRAANFFNMHTFSMVIVGKLYQGRDVVSRAANIIMMDTLENAMYGNASIGQRIRIRTQESALPGGTTEEICYKALDLLHMPVKVVGVILQKID